MEVSLRRYQRMLINTGAGVIILGGWSLIKTFLQYFLNNEAYAQLIEGIEITEDIRFLRVLVFVIMFVLMLIDLLIRLFVGLSARSEGFGKKKRCIYIVIACILAVFQIISTIYSFRSISYLDNTIVDKIVAFLVDLTSLVVIIELIVSAIYVRILRKRIAGIRQEEAVCS